MQQGWVYAAVLVYALSLLGAAFAPKVESKTPDNLQSLATPLSEKRGQHPLVTSDSIPRPVIGFALNVHYTERLDLFLQAIDEMAALGANAVEIVTPAFQTDGSAEQTRIESGVGRGPHRWQLVTILKHARSRGLVTALMPQVLLTHPRGNEWRGKIHPAQWPAWWESYRKVQDYFLAVADECDIQIYCVGSELLSTEKDRDRWQEIISYARQRFKGMLTYSTNWDHYEVPQFWKDLDAIGISGYWDITTLTDSQHPKPEALTMRWLEIREKVLAFSQAQGKPVLLTEVGYPCLPWGLKDPWNYINSKGLPATSDIQAMGYQAFLEAWTDLLKPDSNKHPTTPTQWPIAGPAISRPALGVFFYEWDSYRSGGREDTGYGLRGKPAISILKNWLTDTNTNPD